jgi:hypothetical protein
MYFFYFLINFSPFLITIFLSLSIWLSVGRQRGQVQRAVRRHRGAQGLSDKY